MYDIRENALPIFFQRVNNKPIDISSENFELKSAKISALHYHDVLEIGVCLSGSGKTHIDNRVYEYQRGYCQSIPAGVAHLSTADDKSKWAWVSIKLPDALSKAGITNPEEIVELSNVNNIFCGVFSPIEHPTLAKIILRIVEICREKSQFWSTQCAFAIGDFLIESSKINCNMQEELPKTYQKFTNDKIDELVNYISKNVEDSQKLTESNLSKIVNVSPSTVRRLFTIHTGLSPKEFIIRTKMALAEWLIKNTTLSVTEVALKTGYSDVSGFNRVFKRYYNQSPAKLKKQRS